MGWLINLFGPIAQAGAASLLHDHMQIDLSGHFAYTRKVVTPKLSFLFILFCTQKLCRHAACTYIQTDAPFFLSVSLSLFFFFCTIYFLSIFTDYLQCSSRYFFFISFSMLFIFICFNIFTHILYFPFSVD